MKGAKTDLARAIADCGLSERQEIAVFAYLAGKTKQEAALEAGYGETSGNAVFRSAAVRAAMAKAIDIFLVGELAPAALSVAARMIHDEKTPSGARAQLILGVLDRAGYTARRHEKQGSAGKDVAAMTGDELQAQIDKLQQEIEGRMRDVTPDSAPIDQQVLDMYE